MPRSDLWVEPRGDRCPPARHPTSPAQPPPAPHKDEDGGAEPPSPLTSPAVSHLTSVLSILGSTEATVTTLQSLFHGTGEGGPGTSLSLLSQVPRKHLAPSLPPRPHPRSLRPTPSRGGPALTQTLSPRVTRATALPCSPWLCAVFPHPPRGAAGDASPAPQHQCTPPQQFTRHL